ncbi:MAG: YraN family protein [Bradymonadia bacterium]
MFRYIAAGYTCLETNWHSRDGELDLVFRRENRLIFVEVRARRSGGLVSALDSFSAQKYRRVRRCALLYQYRFGLAELHPMIQLATVTWRFGWPSVQTYSVDEEVEF